MNDTRITMTYHSLDAEALQSRYALRVAARLSVQSELVGSDVVERLRFARERALDRARVQRAAAPGVVPLGVGGTATVALGGGPRSSSPWWLRFGSVLPLLVLVLGLMLIQNQHVRAQISAAAEIDFDLLLDDLPPTAYSDPGFVEFLKTSSD